MVHIQGLSKEDGHEFEANLGYIMRLSQKKPKVWGLIVVAYTYGPSYSGSQSRRHSQACELKASVATQGEPVGKHKCGF